MGRRSNQMFANLTPFDIKPKIEEAQAFGSFKKQDLGQEQLFGFSPELVQGFPSITGPSAHPATAAGPGLPDEAARNPLFDRLVAKGQKGKLTQGDFDLFEKNFGIKPDIVTQEARGAGAFRNRGAFQQRLDEGLHVGVNIERRGDEEAVKQTFGDIIKDRERFLAESRGEAGTAIGKLADAIERDIGEQVGRGVQFNGLGRIQLMQRLRLQFGPGYTKVPAAMRIMERFDSVLGQQSDMGVDAQGNPVDSGLRKLVNQGKTALGLLDKEKFGGARAPGSPPTPNVAPVFSGPELPGGGLGGASPSGGGDVGVRINQ